MRLDGRDLTAMPLGERRKILRDLGLEHSTWQVPDAYDDGPMLLDATLQQGLEGIVSKRLTSRYVFGERTKNWLKFAHRHRRSYVVGGWRPQEGTTDRLAALLVGEPTAEGLLYRGRVGSGIGGTASRSLTPLVAPLGRGDSPFADEVPRVDAAGTFWLEPELVVDVETHGVGYTRLRQPSYCGVRARPPPGGPVRSLVHVPVLLACVATLLVLPPASGADVQLPGPAAARARSTVVLDGVRVRLRRRHGAGRHGEPHPGLPRAGHVLAAHGRRLDRAVRQHRRPDRVRRPGARQAASAGHRHDAARHLPAAVGVRLPGAARLVAAAVPRRRAGRLLGPGQRLALLQPLPQPRAGRVPLVAAGRPPEQLGAADRLPAPVRPLDRHRRSTGARSGTAAPGSSCT